MLSDYKQFKKKVVQTSAEDKYTRLKVVLPELLNLQKHKSCEES
jgi:hypothetical protein